jgi:hypothetical protein
VLEQVAAHGIAHVAEPDERDVHALLERDGGVDPLDASSSNQRDVTVFTWV